MFASKRHIDALPIIAAALAVGIPTIGLAQSGVAQGWELRAGLEAASGSVFTDAGACFGLGCSAAGGWNPGWIAEFQPLGGGAATDPILAIRMSGSRFALTSLSGDGSAGGYTAAIAEQDAPLLAALQRGDTISIDPGREYAVTDLSLRGSSWAIGTVLALCASGGPEVNRPDEAIPAAE